MPEAVAIFFVLCIAVGGVLFARFLPDPEGRDARVQLRRRRRHLAFLAERLHRAQKESWGPTMVGSLRRQIEREEREVADLEAAEAKAGGKPS